jgi:glucose-1-phosphate adenylyltransferase
MGIYCFTRGALDHSMADASLVDFGKNVIPAAVPTKRVQAHVFRGYWEDVGTIASYFHANLALCDPLPPFDFYDANCPVYTHPRFLPASKIEGCHVRRSVLSEGAILSGAEIDGCVVGIRSRVGLGAVVRHSLLLGADYYETVEEIDRDRALGMPAVGIGEECHIEGAIIDKNARIGRGVKIRSAVGQPNRDGDGWHVRDGVVVVSKNATLPDGTQI